MSDEGSSPPRPNQPNAPKSECTELLAELRDQIDAIDRELIKILNQRATLVVRVGDIKRQHGIPIYSPHREQEVLRRALELNQGPLTGHSIEAIFRELMSGSFALEQPLRIGYLGPPGSFSHQAATRHFGSSVSFEDMHEIDGVFTEVVREHCHYGLIPIENSIGGGIVDALDSFRQYGNKVGIYAEVLLAVQHALLANCQPAEVQRIHSRPEVFSQCRQWLSTQYPRAELVPAASTSRAVQTAKTEFDNGSCTGAAAIASTLAGQIYGLNTLFEDIEDNTDNVTRFFVISREKARRSENDKTSVMFSTMHRPGALVQVLRIFEENEINLTHIDKRPSRRENWQYTFFVDFEGHLEEPRVAKAIEEASHHCRELTVLGSYPAALRIL